MKGLFKLSPPAKRKLPGMDRAWVQSRPGSSGGKCGAVYSHPSGYTIQHCGHPTALWPYQHFGPDGVCILAPNGRCFRKLTEAGAAVALRLAKAGV